MRHHKTAALLAFTLIACTAPADAGPRTGFGKPGWGKRVAPKPAERVIPVEASTKERITLRRGTPGWGRR